MDRDRETHTVGKDLRHHLAAQKGQCRGLQPTASPQQKWVCNPRPALPHSTGLASLGVWQIRQGRSVPSSSLQTSFSGPGLREGGAHLLPEAQHPTALPSPPTIQAPARSQAQCHVLWAPGDTVAPNPTHPCLHSAYSQAGKREHPQACRQTDR